MLRSFKFRERGPRRRLTLALFAALLVATLLAIPVGAALAQGTGDGLTLVNDHLSLVERRKDGDFIARPVFSHQLDTLTYGIRDADTGDWLTAMYRVVGGEKRLSDGWEYTFEYPALNDQPDLDPERVYLLVMLASVAGGEPHDFYAVIPVHQPTGLWDRVLGALQPDRWGRAGARWVVEGVHGALCGVIVRISGGQDAANCRGG